MNTRLCVRAARGMLVALLPILLNGCAAGVVGLVAAIYALDDDSGGNSPTVASDLRVDEVIRRLMSANAELHRNTPLILTPEELLVPPGSAEE